MDEPLSNLDAKLRVQTRAEVVELQHRLGVTTVYVTHDQVEAMTMGHRVAVLKDGVLQQCDAPRTLYHEPVNLFVAGFIGSPAMNLIEVGEDRPLRIGDAELELDGAGAAAAGDGGGNITVGFRPETLQVGDGPLSARIRTVEDLGSEMFVHVAVDHRGDSVPLIAKMAPPFDGQPDDNVRLQIAGMTHVFGEDGSRIASSRASLRSPGAVSRS
jgi:multiple sugar transport system ATP-binding protein